MQRHTERLAVYVLHARIIEDVVLISLAIQDELHDCGYTTVDIAASQDQAIKFAEVRCPDLITVDDRLEDGSGIQAIREICRERKLPVVFITADADAILRAVPDAVLLLKPFAPRELVAAIAAAAARPFSFPAEATG